MHRTLRPLARVISGLGLLSLAACATPPAPKPPAATAAPSAPATANAPAPVAAPATAAAPFEYENDPYYRLLMAEFAGQRGHLDVAVKNYVELASSLRDVGLAERATRIAVFARDDESALSAARTWVELDPKDMDARQILAAMYIRHGNADAALEHLEYVVSHDAGQPGNRLRMVANLLGHEDDRQTALAVMEKLVAKHGDDSDALLAYALLAIRAEQLDKARDAMNRIVKRTELSSNVAMAYLAILQKQGKLPQAIEWLDSVLAANPKQFGLRLIYARLLADANRYEEARLQFGMLSTEAPDNSDIVFALGLLNLQANRVDEAAKNFTRLLKLDARTDEAHFYLGQIAEARKEPELALAQYKQVQGGSNYFNAQMRTAMVKAVKGQTDEAIAFLDKLTVEDDEQRFTVARAKGEILTDKNRLEEAMKVYDAVLANGEFHSDLLYTRAMLAERMGKIDVLEKDLRAILAKEPDNSQALNALGYTLADSTKRYDEALALITRALELSPKDFYILDSMGWVLYRLGRLDEAIQYLEKARELRNDPEVAAHLGEVLWVKGDRAAATKTWETALRDTPNDKKLLEVIKRLKP
ncbi:MAG: tetratricopeptide repeat protein [Gammaproteobacteria bacterium]|nr:tetratricopeptide repeat protein [Gammaproteobacteria bacterium]